MGHLNGILARVGGNLNKNFQKSQMPGGVARGGMLKLRFDRYIILISSWSSNGSRSFVWDVMESLISLFNLSLRVKIFDA